VILHLVMTAAAASMPPIEECGGNPQFDRLRTAFSDAVKARDIARLAALASDLIEMDDAGEERGKARLIELMRGELGPDYWRALDPVIEAGCIETDVHIMMPAYATLLNGEDMVVASAKEPIRATPSAKGKIKGYARWERVDRNYGDSGPDYWHVKLRSGRTGYIRSERVYSNYSPFAVFEQVDGQWRLTVLRLIPAD
jgi:hypothetical protein